MVQEIIYTSAEKGLKQGSRGFCTVVSTAGMAINLAERLESMSGYRQAFPMGDPRASQNPVCYSHVTTRLAGKTLHVISRVADAGQDYTGRSNKLAHHIAIESVAGIVVGPARMLRQSGVVVDRWNGEVKTVAPRELPAVPAPNEVTLAAWKSVAGDHGWAGAVAEQLTSSPAPLHVIFQVGTDVIALVQEVIDLLPVSQRWNITFCTYFTRLLAGTECQLRFVLNDTPEATALRNDAKARVIDMTKTLPAASGGNLVSKARGGVIRPEAPSTENSQAFSDLQAAARTRPAATSPAPATRSTAKPGMPGLPQSNPQRPLSPFPDPFEQPRSSIGKWVVIALVLVIVSGTSIAIALNVGGDPDKFSQLGSKIKNDAPEQLDPAVEELKRKREEERVAAEQKEKERLALEEAERAKKEETARLAQQKAAEEAMARSKTEADRKLAEEKRLTALKTEGPFAFIKASVAANDGQFHDAYGQWLFELPRPKTQAKSVALPLRTLGEAVQLSLSQAAKSIFIGTDIQLTVEPDAEAPGDWKLMSQRGSTKSQLHLGTYRIEKLATTADPAQADTEISFEWTSEGERETEGNEPSSHLARWWPLEISVGNAKALFLQRRGIVPDSTPTLSKLLDKGVLELPNQSELTVATIHPSNNHFVAMHWEGRNLKTSSFRLSLLDDQANETDDRDGWTQGNPNVWFLKTDDPVEIVKEPILPDEKTVAIARLEMQATSNSSGLEIHAKFHAKVRLPSIGFVEDLPSPEVNQLLKAFVRQPESVSIETLELYVSKKAQEISRINNNKEEYLKDIAHWEVVALKKLDLPRKWRLGYTTNQRDALDAAKRLHNLESARRDRLPNKQFLVALDEFATAINEIGDAVIAARESLIRAHKDVDFQIKHMRDALEDSSMKVLVGANVSIEGFDNGPMITIYFLDCAKPETIGTIGSGEQSSLIRQIPPENESRGEMQRDANQVEQ